MPEGPLGGPRPAADAKFTLSVYFEEGATFQEGPIESAVRAAAENPTGPATDPMFPDNMLHTVAAIEFSEDYMQPRVDVILTGSGFLGPNAALVSADTVSNMEEATKDNTIGSHFTTVYGAE